MKAVNADVSAIITPQVMLELVTECSNLYAMKSRCGHGLVVRRGLAFNANRWFAIGFGKNWHLFSALEVKVGSGIHDIPLPIRVQNLTVNSPTNCFARLRLPKTS